MCRVCDFFNLFRAMTSSKKIINKSIIPNIVDLEFNMILTGHIVCVFPAKLPIRFKDEDLATITGITKHFDVIINNEAQPSYDVLIPFTSCAATTLRVDILIRPHRLINSRVISKLHNGQRKWYKEFWNFTKDGLFVHPQESTIDKNLKDIFKIYACILQYKVLDYRDKYPNSNNFLCPGRELQGCYHSILRRTGASYDDVVSFVRDWCDLNMDVLNEIEKLVDKNPYQNFFT